MSDIFILLFFPVNSTKTKAFLASFFTFSLFFAVSLIEGCKYKIHTKKRTSNSCIIVFTSLYASVSLELVWENYLFGIRSMVYGLHILQIKGKCVFLEKRFFRTVFWNSNTPITKKNSSCLWKPKRFCQSQTYHLATLLDRQLATSFVYPGRYLQIGIE